MSQKKTDIAKQQTLPHEVAEVIDSLPEAQRKQVEMLFVSQSQMLTRISPEMEIAQKVTPEHISSILSSQDKAMDYTFKENKNKMWFTLALIAIVAIILFGLILALKNNAEVMEKVLIGFMSFAAGGLGGYGLKNRSKEG